LVVALRSNHPHSIRVLSRQSIVEFNCVMHALGIVDDPGYVRLARMCPSDVHASTHFVKFLIEGNHIAEQSEAAADLLIVYSDDIQIRHIGRLLRQDLVESKWGIGLLYEHPILEIPSSYGSAIRYFSPIDRDDVIERFIEFAEASGIILTPTS
jgi:hypothetical protein